MAKTGINYKKSTGEIESVIIVSKDSDLKLNKKSGLSQMEVAPDHPRVSKPEEHEIKDGSVKKKTASRIASEKKAREDKKKIVI